MYEPRSQREFQERKNRFQRLMMSFREPRYISWASCNPEPLCSTATATTVAVVFRIVHPVGTQHVSITQDYFGEDKHRTFPTQARTCDLLDSSYVLTTWIIVLTAGIFFKRFWREKITQYFEYEFDRGSEGKHTNNRKNQGQEQRYFRTSKER